MNQKNTVDVPAVVQEMADFDLAGDSFISARRTLRKIVRMSNKKDSAPLYCSMKERNPTLFQDNS